MKLFKRSIILISKYLLQFLYKKSNGLHALSSFSLRLFIKDVMCSFFCIEQIHFALGRTEGLLLQWLYSGGQRLISFAQPEHTV
jgi:hypothetical protein